MIVSIVIHWFDNLELFLQLNISSTLSPSKMSFLRKNTMQKNGNDYNFKVTKRHFSEALKSEKVLSNAPERRISLSWDPDNQ